MEERKNYICEHRINDMMKRLINAIVFASLALSAFAGENPEPKWIGCEYEGDVLKGATSLPARYLRKEALLDGRVASATLRISGLGLYDAWINGDHITAGQEMSPTVSDYRIRVYYNEFDVTTSLRKGINALAVTLGCGRYTTMRDPGMRGFGIPRLWYSLEITYRNGDKETIVSDETWSVTCEGPVRSNNEFDGETYDARMELGDWTLAGYSGADWDKASVMPAPDGELCLQPNPNIEIQDYVRPVSITDRGDSYILDMGQNMVGWLQLRSKGLSPGDTVTLRFAETLNDDGTLYTKNLRSAKATDRYIAKDSKRFTWHPKYVLHGFRYVEVSGLKKAPKLRDFEGQVLYDKMAVLGSFETSNPVINAVYHNAFWGIRSNYRGMPMDCPQRDERLGWLGDRTMGNFGESYVFDNHALYSKWLIDIEDAQREDGSIPDVVPRYWTLYNDNMTWPGAFITVAEMLNVRFGDDSSIKAHYPAMKKWLDYMRSKYYKDGLMDKDTYGDWCMPPESPELIHSKDTTRITRASYISTPFYYFLLRKMEAFAPIAGHAEDAATFRQQAQEAKALYNAKCFDAEKGFYGNNTVTANLIPLFSGMVPDGREQDVFENIVRKTEVDFNGHISCGVVGTMFLMRVLTEYGRPDLAFKLATNTTYPSWGYMVKNGATTIWELWNGNTADPAMNSANHVMILGDLLVWYYEYLAGIRPAAPGYSEIELKPYPVEGLDWVNCSYESPHGQIVSNWKVSGGKFKWTVRIPQGTAATALVPKADGTRETVKLGPGVHRFTEDY